MSGGVALAILISFLIFLGILSCLAFLLVFGARRGMRMRFVREYPLMSSLDQRYPVQDPPSTSPRSAMPKKSATSAPSHESASPTPSPSPSSTESGLVRAATSGRSSSGAFETKVLTSMLWSRPISETDKSCTEPHHRTVAVSGQVEDVEWFYCKVREAGGLWHEAS